MVQGRKMGALAVAETIVVEVAAIGQELVPHDAAELGMLGWNARALAVYGPIIEAHGTATQREIYRRHVLTAARLAKVNEFEDRLHGRLAG